MKKIKTLSILFLSLFSINYAQEINVGLKGGVNFNSIGELYHIGTANGGGVGVIPAEDTYYTPEKEMGMHVGAFFKIDFGKLYFKPEVNYVSLKSSYPLSQKTANWKSTQIDVPLLLGLEVYNPISIYVGPVFSSISTMELEGVESPILFKKSAMNLHAGILVDFDRFGFDLRYEYGLKPIEEQRIDIVRAVYGTNVARLLEYNVSQIILSVHINIFKFNSGERGHRIRSSWRDRSYPN